MEMMLSAEIMCLLMFLFVCICLLMGFPVAFTLAGASLLFGLGALLMIELGVPIVYDTQLLSAWPQRITAVMISEVLVAVPLFVFMGVMLERSKVAEELLENMGRMFGKIRGGLGYSVCIVGALLAASTGIVGATVVTMGLISLPVMLRLGYDKRLACGSIAASGTLGQIIPPSIVLVLLGDQLTTSYQQAQFKMGIFNPKTVSVTDLFAGALFPGLVLVGMYITYQIIVAIFRPATSPAVPRHESQESDSRGSFAIHLLHSLAPPIILIILVLGSILGGLASPTEAAGVGAVGAIVLAAYRLDEKNSKLIMAAGVSVVLLLVISANFDLRMQRNVIPTADWVAILAAIALFAIMFIGIAQAVYRVWKHRIASGQRILSEVMRTTMEISSMVFIILVGAAMFSLIFRALGGDDVIHELLKGMPGGAVGAMLVVMLMMFLLGFFLDFLEIVFIVVPIVAPVLLQMQINGELMNPVWLGVMMAINLQTSFLTPPFGFALFYLRGVAPPEIKTTDIYMGIIPFVFIQVLMLVVLWFWQDLATWLPTVIFS